MKSEVIDITHATFGQDPILLARDKPPFNVERIIMPGERIFWEKKPMGGKKYLKNADNIPLRFYIVSKREVESEYRAVMKAAKDKL